MTLLNRKFIKNLAVDTSKLADDAVTLDKLATTGEAAGKFLKVGADGVSLEFDTVDASAQINAAVSAEASLREAADLAEVTARDAAIAAEASLREAADLAEVTARDAAIFAAVSAEASLREAADLAEVTARDAAIAAEASLREAADLAEVTARDAAITAAVSAEASLREAADLAEVTARDAAIAAEASIRTDADNALSDRIDGLVSGTTFLPLVKVASADTELKTAANGTLLADVLPLDDESEAPLLALADFAPGDRVFCKDGANSKLWFVHDTVDGLALFDRAVLGDPMFAFSHGNTFVVENDVVGTGLEGPSAYYVAVDGTGNVIDAFKMADFDWNLASGIGIDAIAGLTATTVQAALEALKEQLDDEVSAREAADLAEVTARNAAIATAISNEVTARDAAIAVETSAREAAFAALLRSYSETITLTQTQVDNKSITLQHVPDASYGLFVMPVGGLPQVIVDDYIVTAAVLSWNGLGMDALGLAAGDKISISYFAL